MFGSPHFTLAIKMAGTSSSTNAKPPKTGGDDLDDGLDLDAEFAASSDEGEDYSDDDEQGATARASFGEADVEGEGDLPVLEDIDAAEGVKRKRGADDGEGKGGRGEEPIDEEERKRRKKLKAKEKFKEKKAKVSLPIL